MLISMENRISEGKGLLKATSFDVDMIARNIAARLSHAFDHLFHHSHSNRSADLLDYAEACRSYDLTLVPRFRTSPDGQTALHGMVIKFDERFALSASQIIYRREKGRSETLISMLSGAGVSLPENPERLAAFRALSDISYDDVLLKAETRPETRSLCHRYFTDAVSGKWLDRFHTERVGSGLGTLVVLTSDERKYDPDLKDYVPKLHNKVITRNPDGSYDKLAFDNISTFRTRIVTGIEDPAHVPALIGDGIAVWGYPVEPEQAEADAAPRRRIKDFQIRSTTSATDQMMSDDHRRRAARSAAAAFWSLPHQDRCDIVDVMRNHGVRLPMFDAHTLKMEQPPELLHGIYPKSKSVRELVERVFDPIDGVSLEISKAMMPTITRPPKGSSVFFVDMDKLPLSVFSEGLSLADFITNPEPHLRNLIDRQFPPEFKDVRFAAKFSSSMGLAPSRGKTGEFEPSLTDDQFSVHLFFVVETPVQFDALMRHIHDHQRDNLLPSMVEARLARGDLSDEEAALCRDILAVRGTDGMRYRYLSEAYLNGERPRVDGLGRITDWKRMSDAERKQARRDRAGIAHIDMALKSPNQPFYGAVSQCRDVQTGERIPTALESLGGRTLVAVEGGRSAVRIETDLVQIIEQEKRQSIRSALSRDSNLILLKVPNTTTHGEQTPSDLDAILSPIRRKYAPQIGGVDSFNAPLFRYSIAAWSTIYAAMPHLASDWHAPQLATIRERLLDTIKSDIRSAMDRGADPSKALNYMNGKFENESYRQSWEHVQRSVGRVSIERDKIGLDDLRTHFAHQDAATRRSMLSSMMANSVPSEGIAGGLVNAISTSLRRTSDGQDILFDKDPRTGLLTALMVAQTTEIMRVTDDRNSHVFIMVPDGGDKHVQQLHVYSDIDSALRDRNKPESTAIAIAVFAGEDDACLKEFSTRLQSMNPSVITVDTPRLQQTLEGAGITGVSIDMQRPEGRRASKFPMSFPKTMTSRTR